MYCFIISYEPDQDSFLFLDSLEKEYSFIINQDPFLIVEIGPGSGILSTFLTRVMSTSSCILLFVDSIHPTITIGIDINPDACKITKRTFCQNRAYILISSK